MRVVRSLMFGVILAGMSAPAMAADPGWLDDPVLRGSETIEPPRPIYRPGVPLHVRWSGLYVGGQFGRTFSGADFTGGVSSLVEYILREDIVLDHVRDWTTLPKDDTSASSYGGFIGYNGQWDELVLGLEVNYNRIAASHSVSDSITRTFNDDAVAPANHHFFYTATVTGSAMVELTDFGTIRGRAAVEFGRFLPYAFGGLAIGRGTVTRSATVSYTRIDIPDATTPPTTPLLDATFGPTTRTETSSNQVFYGYTLGLGVDIAVMPNVFVRGEWEWIQFTSLTDVNLHLNTVRAAVGFRF